ncbi:MAG: hypothetical protein ACI9GW_001969 [Halieaceae bacterium]|jgi:hypothetical protein
MTFDEWRDKYEPEQESPTDWEDLPQPTGERLNGFHKYIWTLVECDDANYIIDGAHYVNRIGYFTTKHPFEGDHLEVLDD